MAATPTPDIGFQNFFQATLTGDITASSTDILMDNIPNASQGFLVIEPDSASNREVIFYDSKTALKVVCPSAADGRGQDDTTAVSHSTGATVIMAPIAAYYEALQDGKAVGVRYSPQSSAVNYPTFKNATTGNAVEVQATGDDTNIDVRVVPKGTGNVKRGSSGGAIDWWEELARVTVSSGTTMDTGTFAARKYLKIIIVDTGSAANGTDLIFNNDSGNNYATARTLEGAAFSSAVSQPSMEVMGNYKGMQMTHMDVVNYSSMEKPCSSTWISAPRAGTQNSAAQIPTHGEYAQKWVNTSAQITRVQLTRRGGAYAAGSELVVLGHD